MEINFSPDLPLYRLYGIGLTPLQPVTLSVQGVEHTVHLKMEGFNPTQSMKDRTAYALVQDLEAQGTFFHKESVIIESTSGNLGVALARLCQIKNYSFTAVVDPKTTAENIAKIRAFGAQIDVVTQTDKTGGYLLTRLAYIKQLLESHPNYRWTNQYANAANPSIHYTSTGPEIYEQMHQQMDIIFVPVSTGGTLAGIGRFLREVSPSTQIIGVDAFGSVIFGNPPAPRILTGIGSSQNSRFIHKELYDESIIIKDEEAFALCRLLKESTGISVGGSSGATLAACARYLARHPEPRHIVCVCADHGNNYQSSIFNDAWLQQQGFELPLSHRTSIDQISVCEYLFDR